MVTRVSLPLMAAIGLILLCDSAPATDSVPDFETDIAPLLIRRCVECHQEGNASGELKLTSRAGALAGGESGQAIDFQSPRDSLLLQRIRDGEMPPAEKGKSRKLPATEIELLERWIGSGADWPAARTLDWFERTTDLRAGRDWWSLQPIVRPDVPSLAQQTRPAHPIDAFVRARLRANKLQPAPPADRRTLIRRLYYDLIGLPPTLEQVDAFIADQEPGAWERVIDTLMEMPQYGERWGRYWLDLARYADTSGYERDQEKPFAWKYRDWVVDAFNNDLPYNQFIIQQIAGDEIDDRTEQSVIATGFLRLGTWNDEPNDPQDYQYERLEDLVHTTSSTFLGLTVKCARCHAHKFDPITQEDYYRMAAVFWAGPIKAADRNLLGGPSPQLVGVADVLAWTDVSPHPPPLHLLKNGERAHPMQEIAAASLSSVPELEHTFVPPPEDAKTSRRRWQLATWIAHPDNPLTARVLVNRLWQHHFGQGIVRTPNNFGFLADTPTHPQLLDWLAAEFIDSGGRIKRMHKLILSSQTWQQSAVHPDQQSHARIDPANRLLWHANRRRLDAEALRDSMLAVSGELDLRVGGPGFRPTMSPAALEGLSKKSAAYQASPPQQQQRRSIYAYLKRGLLPPLLTTFDLADATVSCGKRDVTIVPTQALTLLNNQFVHARSRHVAKQVARQSSAPSEQVTRIWEMILKRKPSAAELDLALEHLQRQTSHFAAVDLETKSLETPATSETALVLQLRADQAIHNREGQVVSIDDLSRRRINAYQPDSGARPKIRSNGFGGQPTISFDGEGRYLRINGLPISDQQCSVVAVASDRRNTGHRSILSNWHSDSNVGTSMFLGLTGKSTVRFSDAFADAGRIRDPASPFVITAISGGDQVTVYQNGREIGSMSAALSTRRLDTPWVIGQQGNINGEFWNGEIAELRVYDRDLNVAERQAVERELGARYGIALDDTPPPESITAQQFALASLSHVLLNSNEFIYID